MESSHYAMGRWFVSDRFLPTFERRYNAGHGADEPTLSLDETNLLVRVEAGTMGQQLELMLNSRGYTLHHSPQSLGISTVGGWVATHATGQFSSRWGGIEDLTAALQVVLPQGEIV